MSRPRAQALERRIPQTLNYVVGPADGSRSGRRLQMSPTAAWSYNNMINVLDANILMEPKWPYTKEGNIIQQAETRNDLFDLAKSYGIQIKDNTWLAIINHPTRSNVSVLVKLSDGERYNAEEALAAISELYKDIGSRLETSITENTRKEYFICNIQNGNTRCNSTGRR